LELFKSFDKEPIASASLGQVHRAVTHSGQIVAVKIRHLNVEKVAKADLRTIWRILQLVKRFVNTKGLDNYYHEIKIMIMEELNFEKESEYIKTISANFKDNDDIIFPEVIDELSTSKVLTLSYLKGVKITDIKSLESFGLDRALIAEKLLTAYCQMIFVDGIYHADPHPGNLLIQEDGKIVFLDFGAVGHLSASMRNGLGSFLEAIIKGDEEQLLKSLKVMGFLRIGTEESAIAAKVIEHFHQKFQEEIRLSDFSLSSIKIDTSKGFEQLSDLKQMNVGIRELSRAFYIPREWVLLERAALLLAGICTHLDPHMNPTTTIRPYLEEFVLGKERDWSQMLFDLTREKVLAFLSLPRLFDKFVKQVTTDKITVKVEGVSSSARLIYLAIQQLTFAVMAAATAGAGIYLHHIEKYEFARYSFYSAAGFVVLIFIAMLRSGQK
jgi:predicted unusual protein kinase regulating ubiquinone biosynthesis (AarF/ABC1/UbiB family)